MEKFSRYYQNQILSQSIYVYFCLPYFFNQQYFHPCMIFSEAKVIFYLIMMHSYQKVAMPVTKYFFILEKLGCGKEVSSCTIDSPICVVSFELNSLPRISKEVLWKWSLIKFMLYFWCLAEWLLTDDLLRLILFYIKF